MVLRVRALLQALFRYKIDYVLFGSLGAIAYGANMTTGDLDMCPSTSTRNLKAIAQFLQDYHARPDYVPPHNSIEEVMAWQPEPLTIENLDHRFSTPFGRLDIVPAPYGSNGNQERFDFRELNSRARVFEAFGIPVKVAHIDDIVASKMSRKRTKDLYVETELRRVQGLCARGIISSGLEDRETMVKQTNHFLTNHEHTMTFNA